MKTLQALTLTLTALFYCTRAAKRFAFRQDDIEDYYNSNVQINLLSFFMDRGIPISAGVIGDYFTGQDTALYNALKRCVSLGVDKCALFNHGADATYTYDQATSTQDAYNHMKTCDDKIRSLFNNYKVQMFVPHQNAWNMYTLTAAKQLGYAAVSASVQSYSNLVYDLTKDPLQISQQTTTADYLDSGAWAAHPIDQTVAECESAAALGQVCVIMTHPHEFVSGAYTLTMLQQLTDKLATAGFTGVSFNTIIQEVKGGGIAPSPAPTRRRSPTQAPTSTISASFPPTSYVLTASPSVPKTLTPTSTVKATGKRFAFRQDDIEDYYNSNVQINLLSFFMDRGIPITAGIIGDYFTGQDTALYNALKRCVSLGADKCGLFNHGADATYTYDQATSTQDAYNHMKTCDDKIRSLFSNYKVETFVPHQNAWNIYTLTAAKQLGYSAVSASVDSYSNLPYDVSKDPLQLSQQTTTADYLDSGAWAAHPIDQTVAECESAAALGQVCVIMTHPHEFVSGAYTLTMLQQLIDRLTAAGFTGVNFHSIIQEVKGGGVTTTTATPTFYPTSRNPSALPTVRTAVPTSATPTAATALPTIATSAPTNAVIASTAAPTTAVPTTAPSVQTAPPTAALTTAPSVPKTLTPTATVKATGKRFAFRQDDIEDYYNSNVQINLLSFFMDRGIPITAGIIGDYFTGQDTALYNALKRCVSLGADKCGLFNLGADATYTYDQATSTQDAYNHMKTCDDKIRSLFSNYKVETFVPHQNAWNIYTLTAAKQLGYSAVSASVDSYSNLAYDVSKDPLQLSQQTTTADYLDSGAWAAHPIDQTVAECESAAALGQVCVIMTHPHEFASGAYTLTMLQQLIDRLTAAGFTGVNFHSIIQEVKGGGVATTTPTTAPSAVLRNPTRSPTVSAVLSSSPSSVQITTLAPSVQTSAPSIINPVSTYNPTTDSPLTPSASPTRRRRATFNINSISSAVTATVNSLSAISDIQSSILNFFLDNHIGVCAGILANSFNTADLTLYNALQRCSSTSADLCSLFVQSSDISFVQSSTFSVDEVKTVIQANNDQIKNSFPGYTTDIFAPSSASSINANTLQALKELGYAAISIPSSSDGTLTWDLTTTPIQIIQQTSTGVVGSSGAWEANPNENIINDCIAAAERGEVCVIGVTANEFSDGAYTIDMLKQLIEVLTAAGFTSAVNLETVIHEALGSPATLAPTTAPGDASTSSEGRNHESTSPPPDYLIAAAVIGGLLITTLLIYAVMKYRANHEFIVQKYQRHLELVDVENNFKGEILEEEELPETVANLEIQFEITNHHE